MARVLLLGTQEDEAVARAAAEIVRLGHEPVLDRAEDVDAVVGVGSDEVFRDAARIAEERGLAHPWSAEAAVRGTDVGAARRALAAHEIKQPAFRECATADEARTSVWELGLPVIVRTLGDSIRESANDSRAVAEIAQRAIDGSYRPVCVVEEKVGGGCSRDPRADVDEAMGLPCLSKTVTGGWVVYARALAADAEPEAAVRAVLEAVSARS
jgi:carbamoylphosphate synthase large subunit